MFANFLELLNRILNMVSMNPHMTLPSNKFRPIIDQTVSYTFNTTQVVSNCLKSLYKNEYTVNYTKFFSRTFNLQPLEEDEYNISYDSESPFTNIPVKKIIHYIIDQINANFHEVQI